MTRLLQRLLDPAYLYAIDPGPLGRWKLIYVAWAIALVAGGIAAIWWRQRARNHAFRRAASVTAGACGAGLFFLLVRLVVPWAANSVVPLATHLPPTHARFLLYDVWTARVWPLSATAIAVLAPLFAAASLWRLPRPIQHQVDALTGALDLHDPPPGPWEHVLLAAIHLLGLACLWYSAERPIWWAIPSLLALSALPLSVRPRRLRLETLAPLLPAYIGAALVVAARRLDVDVSAYQAFALPDPLSPWFNVPALVVAGLAYVLWVQVRLVGPCSPGLWSRLFPAVLGAAVFAWLVATVAIHRTHGVTASDPYCYVQMAIDLAETGSPLHDFPLAGLARSLGLPTWPAVHIGYHPPFVDNRSPTMWSIGWPLLLVPFYRLGGTEFLYWAAPLISLLALIVTWCTTIEALRQETRAVRWSAAALACLLVATSPEGSERMLVPMADAAAQLFTMLTFWLLLRGVHRHPVLNGLLSGVSFGMAYFVRHPQLPLGVAALVAAWFVATQRARWRSALLLLALFCLGAFLVAVPDLLYHRSVYGGWLHAESTEWSLISATNVWRSFFAALQQGLLRREELGFVAPFAVYGGWLLWRDPKEGRRAALILGAGFGAVFAFHLFYAALRPRDLIAVFPVLYLCAAYGFVAIWQRGLRQRGLPAALSLLCCAVLLSVRSYRTLSMPWRDDVITFGHVSARQRRALETLRTITPENAVIGSMLNGGAIELHAKRQAVHPTPWTEKELHTWVDALLAQERPFYVLDDGQEMPLLLAHLEGRYAVRPVRTLDLPYFALGGGNLPRLAVLYRVGPGQ